MSWNVLHVKILQKHIFCVFLWERMYFFRELRKAYKHSIKSVSLLLWSSYNAILNKYFTFITDFWLWVSYKENIKACNGGYKFQF